MMMPSASASASRMRLVNGSGQRSQFWVVEQKGCPGGCEAFTGNAGRRVVMEGGVVAIVVMGMVMMGGGMMVV